MTALPSSSPTARRNRSSRVDLHDPRVALSAAAVCLAALVLTGIVALVLPAARRPELTTLHGFTAVDAPPLAHLATLAISAFNMWPYALLGAVLVAAALAQHRPRKACAALMVLVCAPATSELLKPLLARGPGLHAPGQDNIAAASWPSGHATASTAFVLCLILVTPAGARWLSGALGAAVATLVSYSILMLGWHFPSDVLGGQLVAGTWVLVALAGLGASQRRWPSALASGTARALRRPRYVAEAGAGVAALALIAALERVRGIEQFLGPHALFVAGATTIALLALVLSAVVASLSTS